MSTRRATLPAKRWRQVWQRTFSYPHPERNFCNLPECIYCRNPKQFLEAADVSAPPFQVLLVGFRGQTRCRATTHNPGDDTSIDGNDELIGYPGPDTLLGFGGSDYLRGGRGDDLIDATEERDNPGRDTVRGSRDQDFIDAVDCLQDTIFCGRGEDEVFFDEGLDVVADNCEIQHPRS